MIKEKASIFGFCAPTLLLFVLLLIPAVARADEYNIDPGHSKVTFKVKHLGITWVPGKFNDFSGTFSFDPKNIPASAAAASIKAKSIDTDNEKRDGHLRTADFLATDSYSDITFKTTKITPVDDTTFKATGDLKIKDISKPVTLDVVYNGSATGMEGEQRAAFSASTKFNRKDWGINWSKLMESGGLLVGDDILVTIEIEAVKVGTEPKKE